MTKRILSMLLATILILNMLPWTVLAEELEQSGALSALQEAAVSQNETPAAKKNANTAIQIPTFTWSLEGTVLTISGNGPMDNYTADNAAPWGTSVTKVIIQPGITTIGDRAFYFCQQLTDISIPDTVENIGAYAFCSCTQLQKILLPEGIRTIAADAFKNCSGFEQIVVPNSVETIGLGAFNGCTGLTAITVPFVGACRKTAEDILQYPFGYIFGTASYTDGVGYSQSYYSQEVATVTTKYYIPSKLRAVVVTGGQILYGAFSKCANLTSVSLPEGITEIGASAFIDCTSLAKVSIPEGVTAIGSGAFKNCKPLKNPNLPNSLVRIGTDAFSGCNLQYNYTYPGVATLTYLGSTTNPYMVLVGARNVGATLQLHQNTKIIGQGALDALSKLETITLPDGVISIESQAFTECSALKTVSLGNSLTYIGKNAFYYCPSLQNITIPASVDCIDTSAFQNCISLTEIIIPEGVNQLQDSVFRNCTALTKVSLPSSLTHFGSNVFAGCTSLKDNAGYWGNDTNPKLILAKAPSTAITGFSFHKDTKFIASEAFRNCAKLTELVIPEGILTIGSSAFAGCTSLQRVTVPDSTTTLGSSIFSGCSSLCSITLPFIAGRLGFLFGTSSYTGGNPTIQYSPTGTTSTYYIPATLNSIHITGGNAPEQLPYGALSSISVAHITLPETLKKIGDYALAYNTKLDSITLPAGITNIGIHAFAGCTKLYELILPNTVTAIGEYAFKSCKNISAMTIPESVLTVGEGILSDCTELQTLSVPFVGESRKTHSDRNLYPFGYIFGTASNTDATATEQSYYLTPGSGVHTTTYYIPAKLKNVTVTGGCIAYGAFSQCKNLQTVTLKNIVGHLGEYAFYYCTALTNVTLSDGITAAKSYTFSNCTALQTVRIPDSLSSIHSSTFQNCTSLQYATFGSGKYLGNSENPYVILTEVSDKTVTALEIHSSTKVIGPSAFAKCNNLTSVAIPEGVREIGIYAFLGCAKLTGISIPGSVTYMRSDAFSGCTGLTRVDIFDLGAWCHIAFDDAISNPLYFGKTLYLNGVLLTNAEIPYGITEINDYAFYGCSNLTSVNIPNSVTRIGRNAFTKCGFSSVYLPDSLELLDSYAFQNCINLTNIVIPDSVQEIGSSALAGCSSLTSMTIPFVGKKRLSAIEIPQYPLGYIFGGTSYTGGTLTSQFHKYTIQGTYGTYFIPTSLRSVTVTGGYIVAGAFYNCSRLTSITLSGNVGGIGKYAFYNCNSLTQVNIPASATVIETEAFYNCSKLTEIVIPDKVKSIGSSAFSGCTSINKLTIGKGVTTIGSNAFYNCISLTELTVPDQVTSIGSNALSGCFGLQKLTIPFVGESRKTNTDTYQYPLGYIFGTASYAHSAQTTQYYYATNQTTPVSSTYYIPTALRSVTVTDGDLLYGAFSSCSYLIEINLGENILNVNPGAFGSTVDLEAINVAKNNPNYCSECRILYNKDKTQLICKPSKHRYYLTVNYTYANGDKAFDTVTQKYKDGAAYRVDVPELLGYSSRYDEVSGTMPKADLVVDVIYYENDRLTSGQCTETISWTLYDDGALIFRGSGQMPDYTAGNAPWATYADKIQLVYIDPRVTNIGAYAFEGCRSLTFVDYGYSVASIGEYAFAGCSALTAFKLPESVTTISVGAFSGCTGLKNVVIPDNITAIADDAFLSCSQLVQLTVGGAVTQIGSNAFGDCNALTQVYFRGEPAILGSNALGSTGGKYVYYYSTVARWDEAIEDGKWNGYTAIPYNAIAKENFNGTNVYIIKVVDRYNTPLTNAVVNLGSDIQSTNADGMAYYLKPTQPQKLTVSCSNHITFEDAAFTATDKQVMDIIELSDRPSTVQGVSLGGKSIATSVGILNCTDTGTVKIAVSGYSKYTIVKYELHQGDRLIATEKTAANSCTFTVKPSAFEEGQTVLVRMYTSDGHMVASALNIDVIKLASVSESQIIGQLSDINLNVGVGELGDLNFKLPFDGKGDEKIYTMVQGRTIRIGVNLDIKELFEKKETPLAVIQKKVDKAVESFAGIDTDVDLKICGYIEIEYLGNGEYYLKTSYVKLSVGINVSAQGQLSLLGIVGVYFKLNLSANGSLELLISRFTPESGFHLEDLNLSLGVGLGVEGGAFLLWGIGSAGIYGNLDMGLTLGIVPKLKIREVYVTGELGATWSLLWGLKNGTYVIAAGDIYRWPEEAEALAKRFLAAQQDPASYETNDRAYLKDRTQWQSDGDYLQKSVYNNVAPEIVTCGDTTLMIWLDDNAQRADSDFQTLYYSVYTGSGWSVPVAVDDNGTFDCEFDVCAHNGRIYLVYTEMTTQSGTVTPDIADNNSVVAFVNGVEVQVAVYENGSFSTPVQLTNNAICELLPRIESANGSLTATWLESNAVGLAAQPSDSKLRVATLTGDSWSETATVAQVQTTVSDVASVSLQDTAYTAYIVDADGDAQTKEDQALILRGENAASVQLDTGRITAVTSATVAETSVLTWSKDGKLYMICAPEQTPVCLTPETIDSASKFQIIPLSSQQSLLLFVAGNYDTSGNAVDGTDIYSVYIDQDGCLSDAVRLTRTEGYISSYSASYRGEQLMAVFTETFANVEGEDVQTVSHLRNTTLDFYADLIIDNVRYDVTEAQPNTEMPITLRVRNGGAIAIDGITAALYDSAGTLVYTAEQAISLPSGAATECTVTVILPQNIAVDAYRIELLPRQGTVVAKDAHLDDNSAALALAYADLQVDAEQKIIGEKNYIILTVTNTGNAGSQAMLQVYAPNKTGRLLSELQTGVLAPGSAEQYLVDMGALVTAADNMVTCIATADFQDPFTLNNTDTVTLLHVKDETFVTDPEQIIRNPELSAVTAEFDKYAPEDVVVQITAEADCFTAVEGLTENTDYTVDNNGILTVSSKYLSTLPSENHTLKLLFDFGFGDPIVRELTVTVSDSTPVLLTGSIAIAGDPVVGNTVSAHISGLMPQGANLIYTWSVDDMPVSTESAYTIAKADNGKTLALTVTGGTGYTGSFRAELTVTLPQPAAPSAPVIWQIGSDYFAVAAAAGMEYSLDCAVWQDSNRFEGLSPNRLYTVFARLKATDDNLSGQPSAGTYVTTNKMTVTAPAAPVAAATTHTQITLTADPAMEYKLEDGPWTKDPVFTGLQPETDYVFYQRYTETDTAYASPESTAILRTAQRVAIFGTVTGYGNNSEPATVQLLQDDAELCRVVTTDGSYRFAGLIAGAYTLVITKIGHLPLELRVSLETADLQKDVRLTPADYTVIFADEDGTELSREIYHWGDTVIPPADPEKSADEIGAYAFAGWDKNVVPCVGNATYTATYVVNRFYIATLVAGDQVSRYFTLAEAVAAAPENSSMQLLGDTNETIAITKAISLDLNGFNITGEITVTPGITVSVKDSRTDDYTVADAYGYGKLSNAVAGIRAEDSYLMITEEDGVSFHRIDLQMTHMTLRAGETGVYYKSSFAGDEVVARNVTRYGVALSVTGIPTEETIGICSRYDTFLPGSGSNAANGTLLHGVMKSANTDAVNAANAEMDIYGRTYILLQDGRYIFGECVQRSFRQQVELIDAKWNELTVEQQTALLDMYRTYQTVIDSWSISNIRSAAQ